MNFIDENEKGADKEVREDREWYTAEEDGMVQDIQDMYKFEIDEKQVKKPPKTAVNENQKKKPDATQAQQDANKWEEYQLISSGVIRQEQVDTDIIEETDERVDLQVSDVRPPFLDGRVFYTRQQEPVNVVKDKTSDIVKLAKEGSKLVRRMRLEKEKNKNPFIIDRSSTLGKILGDQLKNQEGSEENTDDGVGRDGSVNYKQKSMYGSSMKKSSQTAQSEFSKNKTLEEQR
ncbi:MAG: putative Helicase, C-terminal, partial [Streblomastix strix]